MKSIKQIVTTELIINKSRFINYLIPISNVEAAVEAMSVLKKQYSDANHHCYAYIIGDSQEVQKYSDDGEPSKTAGLPILEVLKKNNLTNILNVTIRYFGGIKLGSGGLVRAYTKSCSQGILECVYTNLKTVCEVAITIPFDLIGNVEQFIRESHSLIETTYDNTVHYLISIDEVDFDTLKDDLNERTSGKAIVEIKKVFKIYA